MKKRLIVLLVMIALIATMTTLVFSSCDKEDEFTVGLICLHDENSPYDNNFIMAMNEVQKELGFKLIIKTNVEENDAAYQAAADLVDQGADIIFADSFGHQSYMLKAAKEFPDVQFCHATGTTAHTDNQPNYHNAFASIYEGRYLAGVVAGMKLKAMMAADSTIVPKIGYVGAWPYAEVKSGYTSFFLGVRSIVPEATMTVKFTNSWYDETAENNTAKALISAGCVLISQHADSMGAPNACEEANVPNVSYNLSTAKACPKTYLVASRIDWAPYYKLAIEATMAGTPFAADWTGTISTGSVKLTEFGAACVEGTEAKVNEVMAKLKSGEIKVYDCANFTVNNEHLTSYIADVIDAGDYKPETEVIKDGVFEESKHRSAPYFDINIDGITIIE